MKAILDNCIPKGLKAHLTAHFDMVKECREMGWAELANGKLLGAAQSEFDVFITVDSGIQFQQNLPKFDLRFVVIKVKRNRIDHLLPLVNDIAKAAYEVEVGQVVLVE